MARLAIFIDGGYVDKLAQNEFSVRVDFQRFADAILNAVLTRTLSR